MEGKIDLSNVARKPKKRKLVTVPKNESTKHERVIGFSNGGGFVTNESKEADEQRKNKKHIVIPLIQGWSHRTPPPNAETAAGVVPRTVSTQGAHSPSTVAAKPTLDEQAAEAILRKARGEADPEDGDADKGAEALTIPLQARQLDEAAPEDAPMLIKNMIPGLRELADPKKKFMHDLNFRPDAQEAKPESYKIAIEDFGEAMLRGMNWTPETGIGVGKNQKVIKPILFQSRPSQLGLGATAKPNDRRQRKRDGPTSKSFLFIRAVVKILQGAHENEYGVVAQVDGVPGLNNILVQVSPGGDKKHDPATERLPEVRIPKKGVSLVDVEQLPAHHVARRLLKWAKNQHEYDIAQAKANQAKAAQQGGEDPMRSTAGESTASARGEPSSARGERPSKRERSPKRKDDGTKKKSKKKRKVWLAPGIRVRVITKGRNKGRHYTKKGVVQVVTGAERDECVVAMDSGEVLDNVRQSELETALPKTDGNVLVVLGKYKGERGKLLKKNSKYEEVTVQFHDDLSIHRFYYDEVSEYVYDDDEEL